MGAINADGEPIMITTNGKNDRPWPLAVCGPDRDLIVANAHECYWYHFEKLYGDGESWPFWSKS